MQSAKKNQGKQFAILVTIITIGLMVASCGSDGPVNPQGNNPVPNRAPGIPTIDTAGGAPADAAVDVSPQPTLRWACTDEDGDVLTYTVHWGTTNTPPIASTDQAETTFGPLTLNYSATFYWQIVAKDPDGETTASPVWSFTTQAATTETISDPNSPTGPTSGDVGASLIYSADGSVSSLGHAVEYQLNWGDGTTSNWGANQDIAHVWTAAGSYEVTARARCIIHPTVLSASSPARTVVISPTAETIEAPNMSGSSDNMAAVGEDAWVSCTATSSNLGHSLEYRFDLGDGRETPWSTDTFGYFQWSTAGTYIIRAQARCAEHTDVVSEWTPGASTEEIEISDATESISKPTIQAHGDFQINWLTGVTISSTSNLGHIVEYLVDWGDGTSSTWTRSALHKYTALGDYSLRVKGRCMTHTNIESEWSDIDTVHVVEPVSQPILTGPATGVEEIPGTYTVSGSTSGLGHDLEYRLFIATSEFSDGEPQAWTTSENLSYTYPVAPGTARTYYVRAQARCIEHLTESILSLPVETVVYDQ